MRRSIFTIAGLAVLATMATAQPFYLRGGFNGWGTSDLMTETSPGSGIYTFTKTGLAPYGTYEYKCAMEDWGSGIEAPRFHNLRYRANGNGEITVFFYTNETPNDGWEPNLRRAGVTTAVSETAPGVYGPLSMVLMGSMHGWNYLAAPAATNIGGVQTVTYDLEAQVDPYEYKFAGNPFDGSGADWEQQAGENGGSGANAKVSVPISGKHKFELDVVNGRYRALPVGSTTVELGITATSGDFGGEGMKFKIETLNGTTVLETQTATVSGGQLKFISAFPGSYDLRIVPVHGDLNNTFLSKKLSTTIPTSGTHAVAVALVNGDANADNSVDLLDYFALSDSYNIALVDENPAFNANADFNKDGSVDLLDYFILSDGYNLAGDEIE